VSLVVLGLVSCRFVPILEILLFPSGEPSTFGETSSRCASLAAISFCGYAVLGATRILGSENDLIASVQRTAAFVFAFSWLFLLFAFSLAANSDDFQAADFHIAVVLASASAASLIWLAVFGGGSFLSALAMFVSTSVVLMVAMLFLDYGAFLLILVHFGLAENPKYLLYGGFFGWLPYIAPAGPMIWWSLKPLAKPERSLPGACA